MVYSRPGRSVIRLDTNKLCELPVWLFPAPKPVG